MSYPEKYRVRTLEYRREGHKNVIALVEAGNKDEAAKSFNVAQSVIDKAVVKGVMHKNTAARRKELMARRLKTLSV